MKQFTLILFLSVIFTSANCQRFADVGLIGGVSSYMGDMNPSKYIYRPSPAYGGFLRYNVNQRVAVRFTGMSTTLRGSDYDFPDRDLSTRNRTEFSNTMIDISGQVEFNWLPYMTGEDKWLNSLYVSGGIGYSKFITISTQSLTIPFGLGFKINLSDRLSTGMEWSFRKTFTDNIDGINNPLGEALFNNKDWYSHLGLFISYKFVKFAADCPVYK